MEMNTIVSEVGTLVDIRDVSVNKELSRDERIAEFVQQIKNPYFRIGDLMLSGSTAIRFVPFSVGISCFFFRCTNPVETSFSSVAARVAGVPKPFRSA